MQKDTAWAKIQRSAVKIALLKNWYSVILPETRFSYPLFMQARMRNGLLVDLPNPPFDLPILIQIFWRYMYGDVIRACIKKDPRILDIGGHIGMFALFAAHTVPNAQIVCYEPDIANHATFKKNVTQHGYEKRITLLPYAIASTSGPRTLFTNPSNTSMNNLYQKNENRGTTGTLTVECKTLEDAIRANDNHPFDFAKIDCEGAEYEMLLTANENVFHALPYMIIEWHRIPRHEPEQLVSLLKERGYTVTWSIKPRIITAIKSH